VRKRGKVDANQREIVDTLRALGASVQSLAMVGDGVPDLLVGYQGRTWLVEVKDGSKPPSRQRLTADQVAWRDTWRGEAPSVVRDRQDCMDMVRGV